MKTILGISESLVGEFDRINNMIPKHPLPSELDKVRKPFKTKLNLLKKEVVRLKEWVTYLEQF